MAFIRRKKVKGRVYLQLVEAYRENGKVKQRVLQHLGVEGRESAEPTASPSFSLPSPAPYPVDTPVWVLNCQDKPERAIVLGWDGEFLRLKVGHGLISETLVKPRRVMGRQYQPGDWVQFWIELGGAEGWHYGTVIEGETTSEACPLPRKPGRELVYIPYQAAGTCTIRYKWLTFDCVMQMPVSRVRPASSSPPPHWQGMEK